MSTISEAVPEPGVTLRGGDLPWQPVSTRLVPVRLLLAAALLGVPLAAAIAVALLVTPWVWCLAGAIVLVAAWFGWLVPRQVTAISWVELDEELVIRKGRLWRTLVSVPYGRLQYVDLQSGPLLRAFGLASIEIHTASPASGGRLSGLPIDDAEALRARLAARGESQRAGL
ncbi:MAG TPA: PH domain-containing protein [Phycicoccus sp.]|nr:PH domain-containing protein [Phycicoccus sp.]